MKEGTTHYPLENEILEYGRFGEIVQCRIIDVIDYKSITAILSCTGLTVKDEDVETWDIFRNYLLVYNTIRYNHETCTWDLDLWIVPDN